jgi:endonuclease-8
MQVLAAQNFLSGTAMPEGPEVRRYADMVGEALTGQVLAGAMARTQQAKAWLQEHAGGLDGQRVQRVHSIGKNLLIRFDDGLFCYSHLMMWGRWQILPNTGDDPVDRRERARLSTPAQHAILLSAPIFQIHRGPLDLVETLRLVGPDILPESQTPDAPFDAEEFLRRLNLPASREREIGAVLLDQEVVAGIGNYLRAEILFECRIDPFRRVAELSDGEVECLCCEIPRVGRLAYETAGATLPPDQRERMKSDATLVYSPSEWGMRHWVFRRTNLPCLRCAEPVRQMKQVTRTWENDEGENEKSRVIYFCPSCQNVPPERLPTRRAPARRAATVPEASGVGKEPGTVAPRAPAASARSRTRGTR